MSTSERGCVRPADVLLALALLALAALSVSAAADYEGGRVRLAIALALQTVPLLWWRARPLRAVVLSAFGVAVEVAGVSAYGDAAGLLGFLVLVVAVPRWAPARDRRVGGCVLAAGFGVHLVAQPHEGPLGLLGPLVTTGAITTAAWAAGSALRRRAERVADLEVESARAARDLQRVVEDERRRIARELHDIVGHALSSISLTAAAAEQHQGDPEQVRHAMHLIRETSRGAADDVRRLVGLLRTAEELDQRAPQPTLADVPRLVDQLRAAGLQVELTCDGDASDIPLGVQLAAYRVVQEGLTNVVKHAPSAAARVRVVADAAGVQIEVEDEGPPPVLPLQRGHGLVGLTERVHLYDGELTTEPSPCGGLRLRAALPRSRHE